MLFVALRLSKVEGDESVEEVGRARIETRTDFRSSFPFFVLVRTLQGKAASMGLTTDQVPEFGHSRQIPDGIDGLSVRRLPSLPSTRRTSS